MTKTQKVSAITLTVTYNATALDTVTVTTPSTAAEFCYKLIADKPREYFVVLHLNIKNEVVAYEIAHIGTTNSCSVCAADVFKSALLSNASAIIVAHNHPTGNSLPSAEDQQVTEKLVKAGQLIGIRVIDSLVIVRDEYSSVIHRINRQAGMLTKAAEVAPAVETKHANPGRKKQWLTP